MWRRILGVLTAAALTLCLLPVTARAAELEIAAPSAVLMEASTGTVLY